MKAVQTGAGLVASLLLLSTTSAAPPATSAAQVPSEPGFTLSEILVIESVGRYGRTLLHTDALEARLVAGDWAPPQAGEAVALPDGTNKTWQPAQLEADGSIRHAALRGGYAYAALDLPGPRTLLLEAGGHSVAYVNGVPRCGDPYQTGYVSLPVALNPGRNHFLFLCSRGELSIRLREPKSPVLLDLRDATLPDLVAGEAVDAWAGIVLVNATERELRGVSMVATCAGQPTATPVMTLPAWSCRKTPVRVLGPAPEQPGSASVELELVRDGVDAETLAGGEVTLRVRGPQESRKITFLSDIDGSVQYYAVQPARPDAGRSEKPALFLTLHGAGVEALGQADSYAPKSWGHVVAPTNRRPFGFDWEDWGRLDALEVLNLAAARLGTDPRRTYLTGHSMGGHGTWHLGATFPDRFAAIAPSAGWISFWSYTGAARYAGDSPLEEILRRATNASDTLALSRNYLRQGVYVLHGEADDNVPVEQARTMRRHLAEFHPDFAYYERPGAGHWWGSACVDWPPLFDFLRHHGRPAREEVRRVEFVTASPAVSAVCDWVTIAAQERSLQHSRVEVELDAGQRRFRGKGENVARLELELRLPEPAENGSQFLLAPGDPVSIELDGQVLEQVGWPADGRIVLARDQGQWSTAADTTSTTGRHKTPARAGPFKEVFRNRVQLVYGTAGTPEENAWALAKARYDAETFWYRGNGALDLIADREFDPRAGAERNVVLYGSADTNAAWAALLGESPLQVHRGRVRVGTEELTGDALAVLAVYPRPGGTTGLVGMVSGTGLAGLRLTERVPYFLSGVGLPDWMVLDAAVLRLGLAGVRAAGFYGPDWALDPDQSAWVGPGAAATAPEAAP